MTLLRSIYLIWVPAVLSGALTLFAAPAQAQDWQVRVETKKLCPSTTGGRLKFYRANPGVIVKLGEASAASVQVDEFTAVAVFKVAPVFKAYTVSVSSPSNPGARVEKIEQESRQIPIDAAGAASIQVSTANTNILVRMLDGDCGEPAAATCSADSPEQQRATHEFRENLLPVLRHPRCANCHGAMDVFDKNTAHPGGSFADQEEALAESGWKACAECHDAAPKIANAPEEQQWRQPITRIARWGLASEKSLCETLKESQDTADEFWKHVLSDNRVNLGFEGKRGHTDLDPEPPPHAQADFNAAVKRWIDAMGGEANWKNAACGCQGLSDSPPASGTIRVRLTSSQSCSGKEGEAFEIAQQAMVALGAKQVVTSDKGIAEFDIPAGRYPVTAGFKDSMLGYVKQNGLIHRPDEAGRFTVTLSEPMENLEVRMFTCDIEGREKARATVTEIGGDIRVLRSNTAGNAFVGMQLRDGDLVTIHGAAKLKWLAGNGVINFDDPKGTAIIRIGPDGPPAGKANPPGRSTLEVLRGIGTFFFPPGDPDVEYDEQGNIIKFRGSRHGVNVGIKGTRFVFGEDSADPNGTLISVSEGVVEVSSTNGSFAPFDLGPGQGVRISSDNQVSPLAAGGQIAAPPTNPLFESNTNRSGSDYANFELPVADPQLCLERCKGDNSCRAWTYVKPGVQGPKAQCWLKNPAPPASSNECCVSGVFPRVIDQQVSFEVNVDRHGSDYASFDMQVANPDQCFERCRGDNHCAAWTFVRPGVQGPLARCYLKNPAPAPTPNDCCVSGAIPVGAALSPPPSQSAGSGIASIEGLWGSSIGSEYHITQSGSSFSWRVTNRPDLNETATGEFLSSTRVKASWASTQDRGSGEGEVILDGSGRATRIEWTNGVVFTRN